MPDSSTTTNLTLAAILQQVFKKNPTVAEGQVKVALDKEVTASQFQSLAALCGPIGQFPAVKRSGYGVSVVFN